MKRISVLDCTLRDGGYVNNWYFGCSNIVKITNNLIESNIDYIECGYLKDSEIHNIDSTIYNQTNNFYFEKSSISKPLLMVNFGEFPVEKLPENSNLYGIRVAFHKVNWKEALDFCKDVQKKGYKVFIQPMLTNSYEDYELLDLIKVVNTFKPYAFYIVDSFGVMKEADLSRLSYLIENNLEKSIKLGYHAHNNFQLAFSNACLFTKLDLNRDLIVDCSVYGMGRGAGNLNTELFVEYLNDKFNSNYEMSSILKIIDDSLNIIYQEKYWGYSLPYFISAKYNCHPNYASYFINKNSLSINDIETIISSIQSEYKDIFNKNYATKLYTDFQSGIQNEKDDLHKLISLFENKTILLLGPGRSITENIEVIKEYTKKYNPIIISVNFHLDLINVDYVFISNSKRYKKIKNLSSNLITTSNVLSNSQFTVRYEEFLYHKGSLKDNALLVLLSILNKCCTSNILLAGFDGYDYGINQNYFDKEYSITLSEKEVNEFNHEMKNALSEFSKSMFIEFITESKYK